MFWWVSAQSGHEQPAVDIFCFCNAQLSEPADVAGTSFNPFLMNCAVWKRFLIVIHISELSFCPFAVNNSGCCGRLSELLQVLSLTCIVIPVCAFVSSFSASHFHLRAGCWLIGFFPPLAREGDMQACDRGRTHTYAHAHTRIMQIRSVSVLLWHYANYHCCALLITIITVVELMRADVSVREGRLEGQSHYQHSLIMLYIAAVYDQSSAAHKEQPFSSALAFCAAPLCESHSGFGRESAAHSDRVRVKDCFTVFEERVWRRGDKWLSCTESNK